MQTFAPLDLGISTVTLFELLAGVERCQQPEHERLKVARLIEPLHLIPFDADAAAEAARIRWTLEQKGSPIGPYDLQLAAQALAIDVTLVTHNTREFQRVPGLRLTDWQKS
jgi:tRNA(fMet)-specific endonuclease VapC